MNKRYIVLLSAFIACTSLAMDEAVLKPKTFSRNSVAAVDYVYTKLPYEMNGLEAEGILTPEKVNERITMLMKTYANERDVSDEQQKEDLEQYIWAYSEMNNKKIYAIESGEPEISRLLASQDGKYIAFGQRDKEKHVSILSLMTQDSVQKWHIAQRWRVEKSFKCLLWLPSKEEIITLRDEEESSMAYKANGESRILEKDEDLSDIAVDAASIGISIKQDTRSVTLKKGKEIWVTDNLTLNEVATYICAQYKGKK